MSDTFTCEACGETFPKKWRDEDAKAEADEIFGEIPTDEISVVCDNCFRAIMGLPPEEKQ